MSGEPEAPRNHGEMPRPASPGRYPERMLPYVSYLRVYEPLRALGEAALDYVPGPSGAGVAQTSVADEQRTVLTRTVGASPAATPTETTGYLLGRDGRRYVCPADLPLRSWLSLTSLGDSIGPAAMTLLMPATSLATADQEFLHWRREHPQAVPHIRQATWGVPRTWFLLVAEDEREAYVAQAVRSVRFRARLADARQRLAAALQVLHRVMDDDDLHDELADLGRWLSAFHDDSWLELDYAGVSRLLGDALADDRSAAEIRAALAALRKGDFAAAGASYRRFEERWRTVNAYERAN